MPEGWEVNFYPADYQDLEVTYTDGVVEIIRDVQFQVSVSDPNPVKCVNGMVSVETHDGIIWTLVGVRKMRFRAEGEE